MDIVPIDVLKSLKKENKHKNALLLLSNKSNKRIIFSSNAFYYIDDKNTYHVLSGLLPVLKRNFWPNTNIKNILRGPNKQQQDGIYKNNKNKKKKKKNHIEKKKIQHALSLAKKNKNKNKTIDEDKGGDGINMEGKGRFFGSIRGTIVHNQLEDFILLDDKNFTKKYGCLHPWTKRILIYIRCTMKWIPIQCEFKIYNKELNIGTAIDMICVNPLNGNLVFLEFKTGYKDYFENSDGYMEKCLGFMPNSPLNWANIQLTFGVIMLLRQNPGININNTSSYVLRIDNDDLMIYHLDNKFIYTMRTSLLNNTITAIIDNKKLTIKNKS